MKTPKPVVKTKKIVTAKPEAVRPKPVVKKEAKKEEKALRVLGLENLHIPIGAHKKRKLLGRGSGSGHGKTSTRGSKGQTSRAGRDFYTGFEGGQTPMIRRFPKRGFFSVNRKVYQIVNLESLAKLKATDITPEILEEKGLIKNKEKLIKILGEGQLASAVNVKAHAFSKKAIELIAKAGGKAEIIKPA
jgi:large subunit ribosomal protein L15